MTLTKEKIIKYWSSGKLLIHKNIKYRIGKMSYGEYFITPYNPNEKETDNFDKKTKWFKKIENNLYTTN
ncbi:hypothetical protein CL633_01480 [bacterium]|nr:hypothetical protein [bacterium]|tara:strand:+ start:2162 stop:2368 length:207 start_codon:yes stop_codon:yes gene_type:complete